MVYTIHEIPIFIAMGVVGKGCPMKDRFPSPLLRWGRETSGGVSVWWGPGLPDHRPGSALTRLEGAVAPTARELSSHAPPCARTPGREPTAGRLELFPGWRSPSVGAPLQ